MRNSKAAGGKLGIKRLHIAQRGFARRRIAHMASRHPSAQAADHFLAVKIASDMAHGAVSVEFGAVKTGDTSGFLSAML